MAFNYVHPPNGQRDRHNTNITNNHNFSYGMNDRPLEFNRNKMPQTQAIEIIDLEDSNPIPSLGGNSNGRNNSNDDTTIYHRDRDRKNNKTSRFSSHMVIEPRIQENRMINGNEANSSKDMSMPCGSGVGQLNDMNPLAQSGLMYPGLMNPNMGGNMANNAGYMMMAGMGGPLMMDPNMLAMGQFAMGPAMHPPVQMPPQGIPVPPEQNMMPQIPPGPVKEIIECTTCTLYPPPPNAPPPTTRERPNGCRTVFVGGLPDNINDAIIAEVFERCGKIFTQRLSKKNFCHIRFFYESSVDAAICLSGYRIRIGNQTDLPNTGRLHVDFAQARDDQYDYECRQRQLQREQRHREKQRQRQISPPPVLHYTEHEAATICDKLKQDETFMTAAQVFVAWLERGDCSKRNVNTFYSMIQSTNSHVRRLLNEKTNYEDEMQKAKDALKQKMHAVLVQFAQIEKVFGAACHKKVWDHFTKAQRKNIEMWKNQASELRTLQMDDFVVRGEDEMDMSDEDESSPVKKKPKNDDPSDQQLKEENDSLRCQLEAYKNEIGLLRSDLMSEIDQKDRELRLAQENARNIKQQLAESKSKQNEDVCKIKDLEARLKSAGVRELLLKTKIADAKGRADTEDDKLSDRSDRNDPTVEENNTIRYKMEVLQGVVESDAKFIGLISTFLNVHPFGASTDYIWSYMHKIDPACSPQQIESLLKRYSSVFKEEISGVGAKLERKWLFGGFNTSLDE